MFRLQTLPETLLTAGEDGPGSPVVQLHSPQTATNLVGLIGDGLRAVYGSTIIAEDDSLQRGNAAVPELYSSSDEETIAPEDASFRTVDQLVASESESDEEQEQAAPPAAPPARSGQTPANPIKSNRTVTRDLRRAEFKELLERKDKLNELIAGTNGILMAMLEELRKR